MRLEELGWDPTLAYYVDEFEGSNLLPGRVATVDRGRLTLLTEAGPLPASWRYPVAMLESAEGVMPAVGDWALVDSATEVPRIVTLLPRRTLLARGIAKGSRATQPLAANVDLVMVVTALDGDFSLRRIERFLVLARSGSVRALIVLSKADLTDNPQEALQLARKTASGLEVVLGSSVTGAGLTDLADEIRAGQTIVLVGSSGVGKSTLINRLLGEDRQRTGAVRESDDRGRHITTRRELLQLPGGGLIIDTPGLREVGMLADEEALLAAFPEIADLSAHCRFGDCSHSQEPDCAVRTAVEEGRLDADRVQGFHRLIREQTSAERRANEHQRRAHERATIGNYRRFVREAHRFKGHDD